MLDNLGVNVTGLVAGLGVGGIAIGLAAQGIFADLFAAIAIIFDRPFRRGDAITYDKSAGTVEAIGMQVDAHPRHHRRGADHRATSKLLDKEIINNTQREYRRIIFTLGVVQRTPVEVLEELPALLKDIVEDNWRQVRPRGLRRVRRAKLRFRASSSIRPARRSRTCTTCATRSAWRSSSGSTTTGIELAYPTQTGFTARPTAG